MNVLYIHSIKKMLMDESNWILLNRYFFNRLKWINEFFYPMYVTQ